MDLRGEVVTHKLFGTGHITAFEDNYITVRFDECDSEKEFVYPSAFGAFLLISNDSLQIQIDTDKSLLAQRTPPRDTCSAAFKSILKPVVVKKSKSKPKPKSVAVKK